MLCIFLIWPGAAETDNEAKESNCRDRRAEIIEVCGGSEVTIENKMSDEVGI